MKNKTIFLVLVATCLFACAKKEGQGQYSYKDVGQSTPIVAGTVVAVREVGITGENTGAGKLIGGGVGAGSGAYLGKGSGKLWAAGAGAVVGAIAGSAGEQALANRKGVEYTIAQESGQKLTIVQELKPEDKIFQVGARVIVQTSGNYQRVLPAESLPEQHR